MSTSPSSKPSSESRLSDAEVVIRILGADPWIRFDMWSARAWQSSQGAIAVTAANGPNINSDENMDSRAVAMFHAANVAKEFADMVNPLTAICSSDVSSYFGAVTPSDLSLDMIVDDGKD